MSETYTQIPNNIIEALATSNLSAAEMRVLLVFLRKINGFHKDSDQISYSQLIEATGLSRQSIANVLAQLRLVKIIRLVKKGVSKKSSNEWTLEQDTSKWQLVKRTRLVMKDGDRQRIRTSQVTLTSQVNPPTSQISSIELVKRTRHTKENTKENTKEIISKDISKTSFGNSDINDLTSYFSEKLGASLDGSVKINRQYASNLIRKIKKDYPDKDPVQAIKVIIDLAIGDDFHSKNATGFKYLFYNAQKIIASYKQKKNTLLKI